MCEFCTKHGEGKKWYLNAKNYSNDLLSDVRRRKFVIDAAQWIADLYRVKFKFLKVVPFKVPVLGNIFRGIIKKGYINTHWGQVIPIEDVEKVLSFTNSITRIPCVCREVIKGKETRTCFLISLDPSEMGIAEIADQSFFGGPDVAKFEKVDKKLTLDFMKESEQRGMIHTIWTFRAPFTGALCNCDYTSGCLAMKMYKEATAVMFRAEYVALVDIGKCVGCQECVKVCQFKAIEFDKKNKKIKIDIKKCYGCGICRAVCKKDTIRLEDRTSVSKVANLWYVN